MQPLHLCFSSSASLPSRCAKRLLLLSLALMSLSLWTAGAAETAPSQAASPTDQRASLTATQKRRLSVAGQLYADAMAQTAESPERARLLREFMERSQDLMNELPDAANVWLLRASAAVELDEPRAGWEAGRNLVRLGLEKSEDDAVQTVLTKLERRQWMGDELPAAVRKAEADKLAQEQAERQQAARRAEEERRRQEEEARNRERQRTQEQEKQNRARETAARLEEFRRGLCGTYADRDYGKGCYWLNLKFTGEGHVTLNERIALLHPFHKLAEGEITGINAEEGNLVGTWVGHTKNDGRSGNFSITMHVDGSFTTTLVKGDYRFRKIK